MASPNLRRGAPLGNQNAAKARLWTAAIDRALKRRSGPERIAAMDRLADVLLDKCEAGDLDAIKEFGNRMEGRPAQLVEMTGAGGGAIKHQFVVSFGRSERPESGNN